MEKIKIKLNADLRSYKSGSQITIKMKDGLPVERYWRDRFKDQKIDNCFEKIGEKKAKENDDFKNRKNKMITTDAMEIKND